MDELLQNPAIRSGIMPFAIAFVSSLLLRPFGWYAVGFGFVGALVAEIGLLVGFDIFPPKVNTHKVIVLGLVAAVLGVVRDAIPGRATAWTVVAVIAAIAGVAWVIYPVLMRLEMADRLIQMGSIAVFVTMLFVAAERLRGLSMMPAVTLTWLGVGIGGAALLGATALYGELGIAVGAASGGIALAAMFGTPPRMGAIILYPGLWFSASVGIAASVFSNLRWYSLTPLVLVPLIAALPVGADWTPRRKAVVFSIPMVVLAGLAVFVTWYSADHGEGSPY